MIAPFPESLTKETPAPRPTLPLMNRAEFLALGAVALATPQPAPAVAQISGGRTYVVPFASAPYPHVSRVNGHDYQGKHYDAASHYSDSSVAIFIPDAWRPEKDAIDFVVHFYGWNHDIAKTLAHYELREQLLLSNRNAILIVPEGPTNAPDSGDGKLELDAGGFQRFMNDVAQWLRASAHSPTDRIGRIVLTAHSGGYGGAGGVLARGGMNDAISDVILFDAAYGYFDAFAKWANGSSDRHFLSVFTDDTSTGNTALMSRMQKPRPNLFVWDADSISLAQLQTRAPTFLLTTTVAHDDLLQKYHWYSLFLQSTALTSR
jgi:hypothetical protein